MLSSAGVHAGSRLTVPNVLTVLRMIMAVVAAVCFATESWVRVAVVLCVVAALLDAFDGWYARKFSQVTSLGEHLDPLADKLLMAVVYGVIAVGMQSVTVWILIGLIALREVAVTLFRSYSLRRRGRFIPANRLGKVKMILQSVVGLAIVGYAYLWKGGFDIHMLVVAAPLALILVVSYIAAAEYVWGENLVTTQDSTASSDSNRMVVGR